MDPYAPAYPVTIKFGKTTTQYKGITKGEHFTFKIYEVLVKKGLTSEVAMKHAILAVKQMCLGFEDGGPIKHSEETQEDLTLT